jgi:F5/8 type C domain
MRKSLIEPHPIDPIVMPNEIDLSKSANIHFSAQALEHPIDHLLDGHSGPDGTYWASGRTNVTEEIVLEFDEPRKITRLVFEAQEREEERTQEISAQYSIDGGAHYRGLFVQEYTFSPGGATFEREDLRFDLQGVTHLRLLVMPHKRGNGRASLSSLRVFG